MSVTSPGPSDIGREGKRPEERVLEMQALAEEALKVEDLKREDQDKTFRGFGSPHGRF